MPKPNTRQRLYIDILGTPYELQFKNEEDDKELLNAGGYCDYVRHLLVVDETLTEHNQKIALRHELTHAFIFECGLREWAINELLVDFIAKQAPKLTLLFDDLGAL